MLSKWKSKIKKGYLQINRDWFMLENNSKMENVFQITTLIQEQLFIWFSDFEVEEERSYWLQRSSLKNNFSNLSIYLRQLLINWKKSFASETMQKILCSLLIQTLSLQIKCIKDLWSLDSWVIGAKPYLTFQFRTRRLYSVKMLMDHGVTLS